MQNPGGPFFASTGDDIKIWDTSKLEVVKQFNFHNGNVKDLAWSRDNMVLCSTSLNGDKIVLSDCQLGTKHKPKVIAEHAIGEHQICVRLSASNRKLYSGGVDGAVCVWDKETGRLRKSYKDTHSHPITCIALNDSESHIASGSNKGDVIIRNLNNDVIMKPITNVDGQAVRAMTFSPWKHSLLGMATDDGSLRLWDTLQGSTYHNFDEIHKAPAMALVFSPLNDLVLASVGLDKCLQVFDIRQRKFLKKVMASQPLTSLSMLHDGYSIYAGSSLGRIYHFDLRQFNRPLKDVSAHTTSVQRIALQSYSKARKGVLKVGRPEAVRSRQTKGAGDQTITSKSEKLRESANIHEKGDIPLTSAQSSRLRQPNDSSSGSEGITNRISVTRGAEVNGNYGNHDVANDETAPYKNSTPTLKIDRRSKPVVDQLDGGISPLGEDVFGNFSVTSLDGNTSAYPADALTNGGITFSSSTDTIGSYCDDILSPLASTTRSSAQGRQGRISVGSQIHSRTSPHPLRQSHGGVTDNPPDPNQNINSTPTFRNRMDATSINQAKQLKPEQTDSPATQSNVRKSPDVKAFQSFSNGEKDLSETSSSSSINPPSQTVQALTNPSIRVNGLPTSGASSSKPISGVGPSGNIPNSDLSVFQYQAEFLRNTVKEMVDELGDNLRGQINEVIHSMVKISLQQEDFIKQLLQERKCGVNEQLLKECERLREENERLKRRF